MKNNNGIFIGIIGIVLIILSRAGLFMRERTDTGYVTGLYEENTLITYPLLIIGIALTLYGASKLSKSLKNNN